MGKDKPSRDWFWHAVIIVWIIVSIHDCVKRERENNKYPRGGYTEEEERIINDYLYKQEQFDREYGTGKQERM